MGGTAVMPDGSEIAMSYGGEPYFLSGGGFSAYNPLPAWQQQAVNGYVTNPNNSLPNANANVYTVTNRAYPDVSWLSTWTTIYESFYGNSNYYNGKDETPEQGTIGGTSLASPMFAAVIGLINDARMAAGMTSVGFINPAIYQGNGRGFKDITVGNNKQPYCTDMYGNPN